MHHVCSIYILTSNNLLRLHNTHPHNFYGTVYVNSGIYDGVGTHLSLDLTNIM